MPSLTANDLKMRGVSAIEETLAGHPEAVISVRGRDKYVVMEVAQYHYLRECELDAALAQSQADLSAGRYVTESARQHMERMESLLAAGSNGRAPVKSARAKTAAVKPAGRKKPAGRTPVR